MIDFASLIAVITDLTGGLIDLVTAAQTPAEEVLS